MYFLLDTNYLHSLVLFFGQVQELFDWWSKYDASRAGETKNTEEKVIIHLTPWVTIPQVILILRLKRIYFLSTTGESVVFNRQEKP